MDDLLLEVTRADHRPRNPPFGLAKTSVTHGNKHEFVIDGAAWLDIISGGA
ncbi:hypothetical protein [Rhizobium sp. BK060]|uniref:hypothetical protein n=1 Tax=Rhizobium sp. BK060 TaxID=2587096 RepID=UPI0016097FA8|nr:hypothetical protein [Rhizobium sp. BK060]MBB3396414.1 hypothetical protein [Rhizobium sp. BK060]